MTVRFASENILRHRRFENAAGKAIYHVADVEGGGYVVTSGDTKISPIVCFSGSGEFDDSDLNPLKALLNGDLDTTAGQPVVLAASAPAASVSAVTTSAEEGETASEREWRELIGEDDPQPGRILSYESVSSVSDVRVSPMVSTKWSQSTWGDCTSTKVYNYYTPNNYVCGCVATAGAQVMMKWGHPTSSVGAGTYDCYVDGSARSLTMKGGTYAWSSMPRSYEATRSISSAQAQAIGKLTYDVGVASHMSYKSGGSGTWAAFLTDALRNRFSYASANSIFLNSGAYVLGTDAVNAIYASLDAGMPVVISIKGSGGHEVVVDGYGYNSGTRYSHLNCGWSGSEDVWYNLMGESLTSHSYTTLDEVGFNIHPTVSGEVISGRVLNSSGTAVSGATVVLEDSSGRRTTTTTNAKGIYSFRVTSAGSYQVSASSGSQVSSASTVSISRSTNSALTRDATYGYFSARGSCGNKWGVNLTLQNASAKPDLCFYSPSGWPASAYLSSEQESTVSKSSFTAADTVYLHVAFKNAGSADVTSAYKIRHEVLNASGSVVKSWVYDASGDDQVAVGAGRWWNGYAWTGLNGLSSGSYTYRCTLDADGNVSEANESNNVVTRAFTVSGGLSLAEAVDNTALSFSTGGGASWFGQTTTSYNGGDAAQSGRISGNQASWMQTTFTGPRTLKFWWRTSSEANYDKLHLYIDGTDVANVSGETSWTQETREITGSGSHTVKWSYEKDGSVDTGSDCGWVDKVELIEQDTSVTISFNANGGSTPVNVSLYDIGATYNYLPTPARSGYAFAGWYTAVSGGTKVAIGDTVPSVDTTLYAHWSSGAVTLSSAAGGGLTYTSGGSAQWFGQKNQTWGGTAAAQSGTVEDGESSWMQTVVTGPGTLSFRWRASSETRYDKLTFSVDGVEGPQLSGYSGSVWSQVSTNLTAGAHTVRWTYSKDGSLSRGWDCGWVEAVQWTASYVNVTFDANGGTVSPSSKTYSVGMIEALYGTLPTPQRSGYQFTGWYTDRTGGTLVSSTTTVRREDHTLYAHWTSAPQLSLSQVLGGGLQFTAPSGAVPWFGQTAVAHDSNGAAQSGAITSGGESSMEAVVAGAGVISFWWKASSEQNYDLVRFFVDDEEVDSISGITGWTSVSQAVSGNGQHVLRWTYSKDTSVDLGSDCGWVDEVSWSGGVPSNEVRLPAAGGSGQSSAFTLSGSCTVSLATRPSWITSLVLHTGSSQIVLNGTGTSTLNLSGSLYFTVTVSANTGATRSWELPVVSTSTGLILYTLKVVQAGSGSGRPNLGFIEAADWPAAVYLSTADDDSREMVDEFDPDETIYLYCCFWNNGDADISSRPFVIRHEVLDASGRTVSTWNYDEDNDMPASLTECRCWSGTEWSGLNGLPPGHYTYRCTLDATGQVSERDEGDNVATYAFEVRGLTLSVTFNGNGGTPATQTWYYTEGLPYGSFPTVTRSGYTFDGWYTDASGGMRVTEGMVAEDFRSVLYAHWTPVLRPNLKVTQLDSSKNRVRADEGFRLKFTVKNDGDGDASASQCGVYAKYDGAASASLLGAVSVSALAAGQQVDCEFDIPAGQFRETADFHAEADMNGAVAESNEGDNRSSVCRVVCEEDSDPCPWSDLQILPDQAMPTVFEQIRLSINGAPAEAGDCIGVFKAGDGRFLGYGTADSQGRVTIVIMAAAGTTVHFKVWDASEGKVLETASRYDRVITPGAINSDMSISVSGGVSELELSFGTAGWHQMSLNVLPDDASPASVFASVLSGISYVTRLDGAYWSPTIGGSLSELVIGEAYWINTRSDGVRTTVSGVAHPEARMRLVEGWNMIGYNLLEPGSAENVLASAVAGGNIRFVCTTGDTALFPYSPLTMRPGLGYWVYANAACTIAYDNEAAVSEFSDVPEFAGSGCPWSGTGIQVDGNVLPTIFEQIAVSVGGAPAPKGDVLAAFRADSGQLCALGTVDDGGLVTLVMYSNAGKVLNFRLWQAADGTVLDCATTAVTPEPGTIEGNMSLAFGGVSERVRISFHANNGGNSVISWTRTVGEPYGSFPSVSWPGHEFLGWFTAQTGGRQVLSTDVVSADVTSLYAHWSGGSNPSNTVTVRFNYGGGEGDEASHVYDVGSPYGYLPEPSGREGYLFTGWYTLSSGGTRITESTVASKTQTTLYAHWERLALHRVSVTGGFIDVGDGAATRISDEPGTWAELYVDEEKIAGGSEFQRWKVSPAGADLGSDFDPFSPWTEIVFPNKDVTITAQYVRNPAATVAFEMSFIGEVEDDVELSLAAWSPDGGATRIPCDFPYYLAAGNYTIKFYAPSGKWRAPADLKITVPRSTDGDIAELWYETVFVAAADSKEITFDACGGRASFSKAWYVEGSGYYQLPSVDERNSYVFDGWWTAKLSGERIEEWDDVDFSKLDARKPTLYAHWLKAVSASITGGVLEDGSTRASGLWPGDAVSISFNYDLLGDTGAFQCWQVSPADADLGEDFDPFDPETIVVMPNADVRITAQYVKKVAGYLTYYLYLDGTGDEEEPLVTWSPDGGKTRVPDGYAYPLAAGSYTISFYSSSADWKVPASAKFALANADELGEAEFEAWFVAAEGARQVMFNANGGKVPVANAWFRGDGCYNGLPEPDVRNGYVFDGWWTAKTGGQQVFDGDDVDFAALEPNKPTLYAHWLKAYTLRLAGMAKAENEDGGSGDSRTPLSTLQGIGVTVYAPDETYGANGSRQVFQRWTVSPANVMLGGDFDATACETSFAMPDKDITLTPNYIGEDKCAWLTMTADTSELQIETVFGEITVEPPEGAFEWSPDGKVWYRNGATAMLAAGTYSVQWRSLSANWAAPSEKPRFKLVAQESYDNEESPAVFTFVPQVTASACTYESGSFSPGCPTGCSVSSTSKDGMVLPGKTVKLTAKAARQYAFVGWMPRGFLDEYGELVVIDAAATLTVDSDLISSFLAVDEETGAAVADMVAVFRPVADYSDEDMDSVFVQAYCGFYGDGLVTRDMRPDGDGTFVLDLPAMVGCAVDYELGFNDLCLPLTFTTSGRLPNGLKFNAGLITGTPSAVGESKFTITAKDPAGHARTLTIAFNVAPMPGWLVGERRAQLFDVLDGICAGVLELSVAKTGRISGKILTEGGTLSVTPTLSWVPGPSDDDPGEFGISYFSSKTVSGELRFIDLMIAPREDGTGAVDYFNNTGNGEALFLSGELVSSEAGLLEDREFKELFFNRYYTATMTPEECACEYLFCESPEQYMAPGYLTIKTDGRGTATVAGKLPDGQSVSATSPLIPVNAGTAELIVFVSPSAYKKNGYLVLAIELTADGFASASSEYGFWKTPPILPSVSTDDVQPTGLMRMSLSGCLYNTALSLKDYYMGNFSADDSGMVVYEYSYRDAENATVLDLTSLVMLPSIEFDIVNGNLSVPRSEKIWKDAEGFYNRAREFPAQRWLVRDSA